MEGIVMADFEIAPVGTVAELAQVKAERDALSAHVERIAAYKDRLEAKKLMPARLAGIIEEHPTTSLARMRDERAQAIQQAVKQARREWAREDAVALARRDL